MGDYSRAISLLRDKGVTFHVHNLCDENEVYCILIGMNYQIAGAFNKDNEAHILRMSNEAVAYRIKDDVYIVPAIVKSVVNNGDGKINIWFDYPKEMKEEGLVTY